MNKKIRHSNLLLLLAVLLIGFLIYSALFRLDNKYTASLPGGYGYNVLQNNPDQIAFLVDGWEYYPGQWLNPEDFNQGITPTTYTYIGQYPNFSTHLDHPYGTATYRILLQNDHPSIDLALYLPELLCAGRVYINGILVGEQGSLSPYTPQVIDSIYSFTATGNTEIIIQCANYTHYYSGLYYPPAVGTSKAIFQMLTIRMAVYGILCFVPLAIALFNLALWVLNRDMLTRWMGLLCLFFSLRMSYPFFHALGISYIRLLYALEDLCGNLVLLCAIMLAGKLAGTVNLWYHRYVAVPAAASLCIIAVLFPLFILPYAPLFINIYGFLLFIWKLLTGLYLLFLAGHALQKDQALGRYLLCAAGFYGLSIAASVLTVNYFEPICGAWLEEYGGFALVVGFAALMALRGVMLARENKKLTLHLQDEVDRKTHGMEILLSERRELLAHLLHDLKNPLAALRSYAELVRLGGVALDQETAGYLDV